MALQRTGYEPTRTVHKIADTVHILRAGRVVISGAPDGLIERSGVRTVISCDRPSSSEVPLPEGALSQEGRLVFEVDNVTAALRSLHEWSASSGCEIANLTIKQPTLDEAYLRLIGESVS